MRLFGYTCSLVAVVLLVIWGLVLWFAPADERPRGDGNGAAHTLDLESRLGIEAEQEGRIRRPRSLHSTETQSPPPRQEPVRGTATEYPDLGQPAGTHLLVAVRPGSRVRIHAEPGGRVTGVAGDRTEFGSPTVFSVAKQAGRWAGVSTAGGPNDRLGWIRLDPRRVELGWTDRSLHVKLSERRVTLRAGRRALRTFTVTVGAPGTETPTGRFAVTDTFRGDLNPVYGCCAVALTAIQPTLRPGWPGGDRIALHGNGTGQPLGIAASNGCLRADDREVSALIEEIDLGTPVFIYS